MFGNLGFGELMVIMVIVLVLFGAKRVPEISASFGKGIREFKKNLNEIEQTVTSPGLGAERTARIEPPVTSYDAPAVSSYDAPVEDRGEEEVRREPKRLL
jgi:sec-independent protein translocase protein TatA